MHNKSRKDKKEVKMNKLHATLKEAQDACKSYYEEGQLRNCTCGTCESTTIETWKIDLERLLWSYHEQGRPDGKTGVIGNPKTIENFVIKLMDEQYNMGKEDGHAMTKRAYCEICRVFIDSDTGERQK